MIKRGDLNFRFILIGVLVVFSAFYIWPIKDTINLGLDLKGGMYILLRADTADIPQNKVNDAINGAIEKVRNRIDSFGVKETSIVVQGDKTILVQVPGVVDRKIVDKLKDVGKLEFKIVQSDKEMTASAIKGEEQPGYQLKYLDEMPLLVSDDNALVGADLAEAFVGFDQYGVPSVKLRFTADGSKKFAVVTGDNVDKRLAIVLDGNVVSAPGIREPILSGEAEITGDFVVEEVRALVSILNSGALPVPLVLEEERSVGPLLGSDSINRGVMSIVIGASLVVLFMLVYYLLGGLVAVVCLFLNLLFVLAGLHMFNATLTLPGIAGMILTLGMAVDANVLIFERIREELENNRPFALAVKNGFDQAKRTIVDANLTTLIATVFLFIYGTGPIRGFATTLSLGIVASIFTAVFVGRTLFAFLLNMHISKMTMLKLLPNSNINFVRLRDICVTISLITICVGMFNFYKSEDQMYGVDFVGGQILEYKITPVTPIEDIRKTFSDSGITDVFIQEFKDIEGGVIVKSKGDISQDTENILDAAYEKVERLKVTTVGPTVGNALKLKALLAIALSLLGILLYVGFRFHHFDFAFAAILALFHDVVITLGVLSFAGYEINLLTVTALLTIAGYSINDTIVIYDRIRELTPRMQGSSLKEVINTAINSTLSRTVITSLTTIMVVFVMYLIGGEALQGFVFTLLVGFIVGTYSSIYIASPVVLLFNRRK
ncbi:MAG: protein translocase subunit SecD [Candidatus Omnitrophica bacterium]|nr:protein translocase subunit SecD [Candidatus Omnitrophota bacterium]